MKPRYYKHCWNRHNCTWFRITHDGKIEKRDNKGKWRKVKDGAFSKIMDKDIREYSEEDYFLEIL